MTTLVKGVRFGLDESLQFEVSNLIPVTATWNFGYSGILLPSRMGPSFMTVLLGPMLNNFKTVGSTYVVDCEKARSSMKDVYVWIGDYWLLISKNDYLQPQLVNGEVSS